MNIILLTYLLMVGLIICYSSNGSDTAEHGSFNPIRQVAPIGAPI